MPKLLISITGGAQRLTLKKRIKNVFRGGLVKAAQSTNAWIITGGFNLGVMKYVGDAMWENSSLFQTKRIVVLGIATWTMTLHNEKLINNVNRNILFHR